MALSRPSGTNCVAAMTLIAISTRLCVELDQYGRHISDFAAKNSPLDASGCFTILDECTLEGLLSRIWQSWGHFCRSCIIESCLGTINATGLVIPGLPDATTEADVSGAVVRASRKRNPPYWGYPNEILRYEPTWGDVDVLVEVLTRIRPNNVNQLLAAFSSGSKIAKALQLIRNGAAHHNVQTLTEIRVLQSSYVVFSITHPTHAMFWIDPKTRAFLIANAIQELKDTALAAIS
jgi:hypothetical protein